MLAITNELAARLETAEALDAADCAEAQHRLEPGSDAAVLSVAGGVAAYLGPTSPLTHAIGMGMHGPVTEEQVEEIEEFFRSRDAHVTIDVCPMADRTLLELLSAREYRVMEFANVLVRPLVAGESFAPEPGPIQTRVADPSEADQWARVDVCGFFGREFLSDEEERIGRILFHMPQGRPVVAEIEGAMAGCGGLSVRSGVASLWADSTLVRYRRQGVHRALIAARLGLAAAAGCDLAAAGTQPGSGSQRDYERFGFQVAYTKVTMTLD